MIFLSYCHQNLINLMRSISSNRSGIIICGPTASGKTDFGHLLAKKYNGEIINCDSMQVYENIPIITSSPHSNLQSELPYHLYNFLKIDEEFSVVKYTKIAAKKVKEISDAGKLPIIVGGTGMYINALLFGYSEIPAISDAVRKYVQDLYLKIGHEEFFCNLTKLDKQVNTKLNRSDKQRALRAYEVLEETGKSIFAFQDSKNITPLSKFNFKVMFLHPERNFLYSMCNHRLEKMFSDGVIQEIMFLNKKCKDLKSSGIKAIGIQEIMDHLDNKITVDEALKLAQTRTRQYAKRQITWFKHQIPNKTTLEYSNLQEFEYLKSII